MPDPARPSDMARWGGLAFTAFGGLIAVIGLVITPRDPAGLFAVLFGAVFIGIGRLIRRVLAVPEGRRQIEVSSHRVEVAGSDGRQGVRSAAIVIAVPADATDAGVEAERRAWLTRQWQRRPDWVEGRVQSDDVRNRRLVDAGVVVWSVIALLMAGAALIWGGFAWLLAAGAALGVLVFGVHAARIRARGRKFGESRLQLDRTPLNRGGRLDGVVRIGVPLFARLDGPFAIRLSCVHRWEETTGSGDSRRRQRRRDTLWHAEATEAGASNADGSLAVPIGFDLPSNHPATTLGGDNDGIIWELSIDAAAPGVDYHATFEVPVLDAATIELLTQPPTGSAR